ncbi:CopG antitoxin of type II toxin-antitoxin system [Thioalkalivibrio sp. ALE21]|nr:CopG antitoxin of type II toxin-antitoxin system [Thioalkalivibrio sp. ALE21]
MSEDRKIPGFQDAEEERAFRESHDSSDYVDWERAAAVELPDLEPSGDTT